MAATSLVLVAAGMCEENCETKTVRLRVTERASLANLLRPFGFVVQTVRKSHTHIHTKEERTITN